MYKIKNIGKTKTFIYNGMNDRVKKNDIEWSMDYDNKNGVDLNVNMDNNGDKSHYHQYLTNSELEELLKMPVVNKSIHQRLLEDFNPYSNTNHRTKNHRTKNHNNNNLDLITYPDNQIAQYPYTMHNDLMNYNQLPLILQSQTDSSNQKPKVIKIKIYTKKHRKHKNHKKHSNRHNKSNHKHSQSKSRRRSNRHSSSNSRR